MEAGTLPKNIPLGVNRRLSKISANKEIFERAKKPYQDALQRSGYTHILEYSPPEDLRTNKKNRKKTCYLVQPTLLSEREDKYWKRVPQPPG